MSLRSLSLSLSFLFAGLVLPGCPSSQDITPRQACEDTSVALCERLYACLTPVEIAAAGLPESEAACVTSEDAKRGCAAQTVENVCVGNEKYSGVEASVCSDQVVGLSCSQVRDPAFQLASGAPACAKICEVPQ
jgi:hypothetical protein